jgi:hypothetical protein
MSKIFIDTNIFLNYYGSNNYDDLQLVVEEIRKNYEKFVFPNQVLDEYRRNRCKKITEYNSNHFKNLSVCKPNFFSIDADVEEFNRLTIEYNKSYKIIEKKITNLIEKPENDIIYSLVNEMYNSEKVLKIDTTSLTLIEKAKNRFYFGNPPGSSSKTCCDELIWESLLTIDDDLIIVTKDNKAYKDNNNEIFLRNEYKQKTHRKLFPIQNKIMDAFTLIGNKPDKKAKKAENDIIANNKKFEKEFSDIYKEFIYDSNGNEFQFCMRCRRHTIRNGVICTSCGCIDCE